MFEYYYSNINNNAFLLTKFTNRADSGRVLNCFHYQGLFLYLKATDQLFALIAFLSL